MRLVLCSPTALRLHGDLSGPGHESSCSCLSGVHMKEERARKTALIATWGGGKHSLAGSLLIADYYVDRHGQSINGKRW